MLKLISCPILIIGTLAVSAAPLPVTPFPANGEEIDSWVLKDLPAQKLNAGAVAATQLSVPALTEKEGGLPGAWYGVVSVDLYGVVGKEQGQVIVELFDLPTSEVIASATATVSGIPERSAWNVIASSEQNGAAAMLAFDGSPDTMWHSNYDKITNPLPQWIGMEFGTPVTFPGVRFMPRAVGGNGVPRTYRLEVKREGGDWETILEGRTESGAIHDAIELKPDSPIDITAYRFVILEDWGDGFGSAAHLEVPGLVLPDQRKVQPSSRVSAAIPAEMMKKLVGHTVGLRLRNSGDAPVVFGEPRLTRLNDAPTGGLFGRSNGGLGPDKMGAGLLGFTAISEHRQTILTVLSVHKKSQAKAAGLKPGDAILAIEGISLSENNIAPGWDWFHHSHEAFIGRKTEEALRSGKRQLAMTILRDGETSEIEIALDRTSPFTTLNPADDPVAAAMLADMITFLKDSQSEDGSWSGDMIRTCFSALALMSTGETKYRRNIRRAVDWAKHRFPEPDNYGNLGFWAGAYAGMLYAETYLATGDRSVLPYMKALRDWAVAGQHMSSWGVPALGHGPDGLPYDNKALVAPACHLLVAEALALRCGQESSIWELLLPYMEMSWSDPQEGGHGSLGYNRSYKDREEFWSRTGLFAMAAHLRAERPDMRDPMIGFMNEHHPWLRNSHAYGEPGGGLGLLALNLVAPDHYLNIIRQYAWSFSLAWEPGYGLRFTQPHMGAPYMGEDDLMNAVYALVLQGPRRSLHLTGKIVSN